jgi:hypothetical protein
MEMIGQLHSAASLIPEKGTRVPLGRRLLWPQSQSERSGMQKTKYIFLPEIELEGAQPVTYR